MAVSLCHNPNPLDKVARGEPSEEGSTLWGGRRGQGARGLRWGEHKGRDWLRLRLLKHFATLTVKLGMALVVLRGLL